MNRDETIRTLSRRMKTRMFEIGMTETRLAKEIGTNAESSGGYVRMLHFPSAFKLAQIAEVLQCSTDWLLGMEKHYDIERREL